MAYELTEMKINMLKMSDPTITDVKATNTAIAVVKGDTTFRFVEVVTREQGNVLKPTGKLKYKSKQYQIGRRQITSFKDEPVANMLLMVLNM